MAAWVSGPDHRQAPDPPGRRPTARGHRWEPTEPGAAQNVAGKQPADGIAATDGVSFGAPTLAAGGAVIVGALHGEVAQAGDEAFGPPVHVASWGPTPPAGEGSIGIVGGISIEPVLQKAGGDLYCFVPDQGFHGFETKVGQGSFPQEPAQFREDFRCQRAFEAPFWAVASAPACKLASWASHDWSLTSINSRLNSRKRLNSASCCW
jgi:hypothetical protein